MRRLLSLVLGCMMVFIFVLPACGSVYTDTINHWAEQDILKMSAKGIIHGDGNGLFAPDRTISRQEAMALIVGLTGKDGQDQGTATNFNIQEIAPGVSSWASTYLGVAVDQKIISFDELRTYAWNEDAQRQEIAEWLCKAMNLAPVESDSEAILQQFKDADKINTAKIQYILPILKDKIMVGNDGYLRPADALTRAEAAVIVNTADKKYTTGLTRSEQGQILSIKNNPVATMALMTLSANEITKAVSAQVVLYKNGKKLVVSDLAVGEWLDYIIDKNNNIVYAEVISDPTIDENISTDNPYGDYIIYRATLDKVDSLQHKIDLETGTIYSLKNEVWSSQAGSLQLDVPSSVPIYYNRDKIDLNVLGNHEDEGIYVVYDNKLSKVVKLKVQEGNEVVIHTTVRQINADYSYLKIDDLSTIVNYDDSSTVFNKAQILNNKNIPNYVKTYLILDHSNSTDHIVLMKIGDSINPEIE